jgi:hypothetical protein
MRLAGSAWAWIGLVIGLLAMAPGLVARFDVERSNDVYELTIPDTELVGLRLAGIAPETVDAELEAAGLTSVTVGMLTIEELERAGRLAVLDRSDLLALLVLAGEPASALPATGDAFVALPDDDRGILDRIALGGPQLEIEPITVAGQQLHVLSGIEDLAETPLIFDLDRVAALVDRGLGVIARVPPTATSVELVTAELGRLHDEFGVDRIVFDGTPVPFHAVPEAEGVFARWLRDAGFSVLLIEFTEQPGIETYARVLGRAIRLHPLPLEQEADAQGAIDRAVRSVKERNIRVIFIRPTPMAAGTDRLVELTEVVAGTRAEMPAAFRPGIAVPFDDLEATPLLTVGGVIAAASIAGAFGGLLGMPAGVAAAGLIGLLAVLSAVTGSGMLGDLLRLGVAGLASVLAVFVAQPRAGIGSATVAYVGALGVVIAGGLTLAGLAYSTTFLVSLRDFWGVKALLVGPPAVVAAYAVYRSLGNPGRAGALPALNMPIRAWHVLAMAIMAGIVGYLLLRSDNTGAASDLELVFRQQLEDLFYVRPRTKEFLIGFPALLLGVVLAWRSPHAWWLYAVGAIGTAGAIDSFSHFHTPLLVSLLRTGSAAALGYVIGLAGLGLVWLLLRLLARLDILPRR